MNKFGITVVTSEQLEKVLSEGGILEMIGKSMMEFDNPDEMKQATVKMNRRIFMSQMQIVQRLPREEFQKLHDFGDARTGWNYKDVTEVGNYRFQEVAVIDSANVLSRRYFILDFSETEMVDNSERTKYIYEIDMNTFAMLVSDICSCKLDIEQNINVESARKGLRDAEEFLQEFIEDYLERLELVKDLDKE